MIVKNSGYYQRSSDITIKSSDNFFKYSHIKSLIMRITRKNNKYINPPPEDTIDEIEDLIGEGDLDSALLVTNQALTKTPDSLDLLTLKGDILLDMERYDEASIVYDRVLELDPYFSEVWANKSCLLLALEHFEASLYAANKAIEYSLDGSFMLTTKAESLLGLKRYDEAMKIVECVLKEDPENVSALDLKAEIFSEMGMHDRAIKQLEQLSDLDPWSIDTLVSLSGEYISARNFSKALEAADRAITRARNDPMAWGNKAEALYELGESNGALECILKAQSIDPTDDETWYQKARILSKKDPNVALDSLLVAVSINPENRQRAQTEKSFVDFQKYDRFKKMIQARFVNTANKGN